ncbi:MAG: T9SS type A sorting domain-containing protein [Bacteroidetes bacterium]|nr:T9SS type A sorting domain-containing protein [Bacteroidota bacterium]
MVQDGRIENENEINVINLHPGLYYLELRPEEDCVRVFKIIKSGE